MLKFVNKSRVTKGKMARELVYFCIGMLVAVCTWAMIVKTAAVLLDRQCDLSDVLIFAGGAFGGVLKASAMQSVLTNAFSGLTIGILAPFLIGFIFRTCVGSATIAMVTAATMITPLIDVLGFSSPMGRVIAMLACAAGGMMVFHGNDDFFWVFWQLHKLVLDGLYLALKVQ